MNKYEQYLMDKKNAEMAGIRETMDRITQILTRLQQEIEDQRLTHPTRQGEPIRSPGFWGRLSALFR